MMVATQAKKSDARSPATSATAMSDRSSPDLAASKVASLDAGPLTKYPGGKNGAGIYQRLINLMPPHRVYIEAFLGSGAILRRKRAAAENYGIDVDAGVIARHGVGGPQMRYVIADAVEWLSARYSTRGRSWCENELIYCDPPYLGETRSRATRQIYRHEMLSVERHAELLQILTSLPAMVMISGYRGKLYDRYLGDWHRIDYQAMTRGGLKPECVWINYAVPTELHDYRFLGTDFHDRCRIGRKIARWTRRLAALPPLERAAIIAALGVGAAKS